MGEDDEMVTRLGLWHEAPPGADWKSHPRRGDECDEQVLTGMWGDAPHGGRRSGNEPCPECSRIVSGAESPIRAFAWLVKTRAHLDHAPLVFYHDDDLPF